MKVTHSPVTPEPVSVPLIVTVTFLSARRASIAEGLTVSEVSVGLLASVLLITRKENGWCFCCSDHHCTVRALSEWSTRSRLSRQRCVPAPTKRGIVIDPTYVPSRESPFTRFSSPPAEKL